MKTTTLISIVFSILFCVKKIMLTMKVFGAALGADMWRGEKEMMQILMMKNLGKNLYSKYVYL